MTDIIDNIHNRIIETKRNSKNIDGLNMVVYVDYETWNKLMVECKYHSVVDMYQSNARSVFGYPIYRVDDDKHGIKVFSYYD